MNLEFFSLTPNRLLNEEEIDSSDDEEGEKSEESAERPRNLGEAIASVTRLINFCKIEGETDSLISLYNLKGNLENSLILKKNNAVQTQITDFFK